MPNDGEIATQNDNQQQNPVSAESQIVNVELQTHSDVKLQNRENVHSDSENNQHEGNEEIPDENTHEDSDFERDNMQKRKEPVLAKYVRRHHPTDQIIGDKEARPMTRTRLRSEACLLSKMEPRIVREAIQDDNWYNAMKEEIEKNKTWTLVPRLVDKNVIGTKWVFRNKLDENGEIIRNNERLVCKGYAQEEGLDYGEPFSLVARIEGVRNLLAYIAYKRFKVYISKWYTRIESLHRATRRIF